MSEQSNLVRKLIYAVVIAALLFPLSWLGSPLAGRTNADGVASTSGGSLAVYRDEHGLSQANLGEIDPASETLKLATLGLRGVAVNALWMKATDFKMKEDWGNLTATLEQLAKLQPNYITFWKYQAWNLTYNVSVEFDDYRDRYYYVTRGIKFLKEGEHYNEDNPQLLWELGWFIGQKIGKADEKVQYRRLFRTDTDPEVHPEDRPREQRDNWLVGKEWFRDAERAAEKPREGGTEPRGIGRKSPIVFYSSAPKCQMHYGESMEDEGRFDRGLPAWRLAGEEWDDFGNLPIEHSTGTILNLNEEEYLRDAVAVARKELVDMAPEVTGPYFDSIRASLTDEQRAAYETPAQERSAEQGELARQAEFQLEPESQSIVELIVNWAHENDQPELRLEALHQGEKLAKLNDRLRKTLSYKQTANYDYWKLRCEFEQSPPAVEARRFCYQGKRAMIDDADPERSKELYARGFEQWKVVLDTYPALRDVDDTTGDDILQFIKEYAEVLDKIDEEIPNDFPLWDIIENFDLDGEFTQEVAEHKRRMGEDSGESTEADGQAEEGGSAAEGL